MKHLICIIFFAFFSNSAYSQDDHKFEFDYTIKSDAFGDDREITVYLPPSFYRYPEDKFTVTYILDGHFDPFINLAVKTIEYNTYMQNYTPTIVVGIHAKQRGWEFSAPIAGDKHDEEYKGGRAPELQQHFKNEVFPLVDSIYKDKILPFRNIIGHSSGGAFVLYSLFSGEKDLFDGYIAISPGIREDSEYILKNAADRLAGGEQFSKFLYCSSGSVGEREEIFGGAVDRLDSILQRNPNHGLIWRTSKFEGMDHWTCVPPSFNTGMVELTKAFRVDEQMFYDFSNYQNVSMVEQIESFYKERKDEYGFIELPSPGYINNIGWALRNKGKLEVALEVFNWGTTQYPNHYTLPKSKAKLLLVMGNKPDALLAFKAAKVNLERLKDEFSEDNYKEKLKYLDEKIAESK